MNLYTPEVIKIILGSGSGKTVRTDLRINQADQIPKNKPGTVAKTGI